MSNMISVGKAKAKFCALVETVGKGETHIITVHGEPVAELRPVRSKTREMAEAWKEERKKFPLNPPGMKRLSIPEMIRESRK